MTLLTLNLQADAIAEAGRLTAARAWRRPDGDDVPGGSGGSDRLVARARGRGRRRLADRAVLIFAVTWQDGEGRVIESQLIALAVRLGSDRSRSLTPRRDRVRAMVRAAEIAAVPHIEAESRRLRSVAAAAADR